MFCAIVYVYVKNAFYNAIAFLSQMYSKEITLQKSKSK